MTVTCKQLNTCICHVLDKCSYKNNPSKFDFSAAEVIWRHVVDKTREVNGRWRVGESPRTGIQYAHLVIAVICSGSLWYVYFVSGPISLCLCSGGAEAKSCYWYCECCVEWGHQGTRQVRFNCLIFHSHSWSVFGRFNLLLAVDDFNGCFNPTSLKVDKQWVCITDLPVCVQSDLGSTVVKWLVPFTCLTIPVLKWHATHHRWHIGSVLMSCLVTIYVVENSSIVHA